MGLSVVIPSKKTENLTACFAALRKCEPGLRVIVIDDGLDRNVLNDGWLYRNGPAWLISGVQPFVFARNVNIGIEKAWRDDVVLMNDDALLETEGGLSGLRAQWIRHPDFGLIASSVDSCGTPGQIRQPGDRLREEKVMLAFICIFIPRATIDRVGLLDERFAVNAGGAGKRGYGLEDDDYSWRVRQLGLKLGVWDGCFVNHTKLQSTFRCDPEHPYDVQIHEKLFEEKWGLHPRKAGPVVPLRLNLGACDVKMPGWVGVDLVPPADVIADLAKRWPWPDSSVDEVLAQDIFEHLPDKRHTMGELWRVLKPGALATIEVPCAAHGAGAFQDPSHLSFWTGNDFGYFEVGNPNRERFKDHYGIKAGFRILEGSHRHYNGHYDEVWKFRIKLQAVK